MTFYKVDSKETRSSNNSMQSNGFFFDNRKMTRARDDECCEFRIMHQIKFQKLLRGHHVYKNVCSPYKRETLIAQPDIGMRHKKMINTLLAFTRKTMIDQKNWLAMHRLSFQAYCIILKFASTLQIASTLK